MKTNTKLVTSLLLLLVAFIAGCSNCDDGTSSDNSQEKQAAKIDSTYTK